MTRFIDTGSIESIIKGTAIERFPVFRKPVTDVTLMDMTVLTKRCEMHLGYKSGRAIMKAVIAELTKLQMLGVIDSCDATRYRLPTPRLTVGELRRILLKFNQMERRAIVVALTARVSLDTALGFQHNQIKKESNINRWPQELNRFIQATPRHLTCPYVFWEFDELHQAQPLSNFNQKFTDITKASWRVFATLCDSLVPIDSEQDAKEFAAMFVLESVADH